MMMLPRGSAPELCKLEEEHEKKRLETQKALEALSNARHLALIQLQKTQVFFKHLNWKQQERIDTICGGNFSLQRLYSISSNNTGIVTGIPDEPALPVSSARTASYVQHLKTMRKNILHFGIIEARARELIEAIVKSALVFNHQYRTACRELFPLGFISIMVRNLRRFFNRHYFSWQEISCLGNLGIAAGFVLKMAEIPVSGTSGGATR